jgi:hypothetical protein
MSLTSVRFPPRRELPRDVPIERLPGLGTTWYDRGGRYWVRRAAMVLMWLFVIALLTAFAVGLFTAIRHSSQTAFVVVLTIWVAWTIGTLAFLAVRAARMRNVAVPQPMLRLPKAPAALAGVATVVATVVVAFCFVVGLLFGGLYIWLLIDALRPEPAIERQARLRMAQTLQARGLDQQTG